MADPTSQSQNQDTKVSIPHPIQSGSDQSTSIPIPSPVLTRQPSSGSRTSCLCSPTTHAGSFRCRLHRSPSLQRTRSNVDSNGETCNPSNAVEAQEKLVLSK